VYFRTLVQPSIFPERLLSAWLPVPKRPNGAMLLGHFSQQHPGQVEPHLERMRTEDIATAGAQAVEVIVSEDNGI
jgi:hypothetical protein